ncbi:MAG: sigma-54-dependent Fis family transcriptional regulator [Acidobacteria bacterium]|nr:sigma-54-dependent Fis family transcriptional regulator [Acidobacteriota bacterium]
MLSTAIKKAGFHVDEAADGASAAEKIRKQPYQLIITDLRLPALSGLEILKIQKEIDSTIPVLLMTAYGTIEEAVEAMKQGAFDFVPKPVDISHLFLLIDRALAQRRLLVENILLKEEFQRAYGIPKIIGESQAIQDVSRNVQRVAQTGATVLLTGESGTGKEVFSRAIHQLSPRRDKPFVTVNCAAIPHSLIENELFGHERGSYTGAFARKMGKFELADQGTIFLDEVGELHMSVQAKVLRVIEEQSFERIGGLETIQVDTRVVAATNRNLQDLVARKEFREDLFFRLSVIPIQIPPLRDRISDLRPLAQFFLDKFSKELHRPTIHLSPEAARAMEEYSWPGNVRELQNTIERAVILSDGKTIRAEDLTFAFEARKRADDFVHLLDLSGSLTEVSNRASRAAERLKIKQALDLSNWNKTQAAGMLDVSYKTLLNKVKEYELE